MPPENRFELGARALRRKMQLRQRARVADFPSWMVVMSIMVGDGAYLYSIARHDLKAIRTA